MAAVASMKPGGQHAALQTFPYVFQQDFNAGTAYFPSQTGPAIPLMIGETFQSQYHQQKQKDAIQSVYNGLANNRAKEQKLLTGTANYHLPRPVLGQRVFANPSLGAGETSSARLDTGRAPWHLMETSTHLMPATMNAHQMSGSGMYGGVMKTREGFDYYTANLRARIEQLNAMNSLATGSPVPRGALTRPTSDSRNTGSIDKVEFFLLLQSLQDSITEGDLTRFTFDNLKKLMSAMFRFGPTAEKEDFNDMVSSISSIRLDLEQGTEEIADDGGGNRFANPDYAQTLILYMEGLNEYVAQMFANMNLSEKDRTTLSKSLIKTLGFTKLQNKKIPGEVVEAVRPGNERVNQAAEDFDDQFGGDGPDGGDGHFNHPAEAREDEDQDNRPRAPFAAEGNGGDPNRDAWGAERAPGAREQNFAYFGAQEEDLPQMVEPLNFAGNEGMQIPGMDPAIAAEQVSNAINDFLGTGGGGAASRFNAMTSGMQPAMFVNTLVTTLERDGMAPGDIASGMQELNQEFRGVFNDYINQHNPNQRMQAAAPRPMAPRPMAPRPMPVPVNNSPIAQAIRDYNIRERLQVRELSKSRLVSLAKAIGYEPRHSTGEKTIRNEIIKRIKDSDVIANF